MTQDAMKQALEFFESGNFVYPTKIATDLRQAIAELESQEPVAWMKPDVLCDRACMYLCTKGFTQFPECATIHPPQLEQNFCPRCGKRTNDIHTCTPPQRTWVGLTDDEIDTWNIVGHESLREFVRAIEAKLKEKNT
jgi:hypothetical protein